MPNAKYRISAMLGKINQCMDLSNGDVPLPYKVFRAFMIGREDIEPVMVDERTCKEKYKLLHSLGIISSTDLLIIAHVSEYINPGERP